MSGRGLSKAAIPALALSGWLVCGGASHLEAQDSPSSRDSDRAARDRGRSRDGGPGGRAGGMGRRFDERSPGIGEPLPEIAAYDADGKSMQLRSALRGYYSVIVFGCLT